MASKDKFQGDMGLGQPCPFLLGEFAILSPSATLNQRSGLILVSGWGCGNG